MKRSAWYGILCWVLLSSSCVTDPTVQQAPRSSERISQKGYSFIPLRGVEWVIRAPNPDQLIMNMRGGGPDETFAIQGLLVALPPFASAEELALFVKDSQTKGTDPERFKMIKHEVSAEHQKGTICIRSYALSEDVAPVKHSERAGSLFFETLTITCAHPRNQRIGVNVSYSHRSYAEHRDPQFVKKGSRVLQSIEFSDL